MDSAHQPVGSSRTAGAVRRDKHGRDKHGRNKRGFALVVTLSMMILLLVLAVSVLTLSSVSLRQSNQDKAMQEARANARMALMIAIGELQKDVGPDRAITATSEILASGSVAVSKPNTTGVWESWSNFNPNASPNYAAEKSARFKRWLVSSANVSATESLEFVNAPWSGRTVELVGNGTLGVVAPDEDKVTAGLVPISKSGKVEGAYAWHVADESVKARVNLYRDPSRNATLAEKRDLTAGHRPDPSVLKSADGTLLTCFPVDGTPAEFADAEASRAKVIDLEQAELLNGAMGKIKPLRHDITPHSLGVIANVRDGGLKQDLSSVFEMADEAGLGLPAAFQNRKLYASTHGITGVSDPKWSALASYYNSFRKLSSPENDPTFVMETGTATSDAVPDEFRPAPVIAKVETIYSLVGRPLTDIFWLSSNPTWDVCANLIVTPVVTLHNPYNVSVSFHRMEVTFSNTPIAFNYMLDQGTGFKSQGVRPGTFEPLNTMNYWNYRGHKNFVISIANWSNNDPLSKSAAVAGDITLAPGQTMVCSPVLPAAASFKSDSSSGKSAVGFDWWNDLTDQIKAKPGFIPGLGFEISGVCISHMRPGAFNGANYGSWCWFLMLRDRNVTPKVSSSTVTDEFYVEFKLQKPFWYLNDSNWSTIADGAVAPEFDVSAKIMPTAGGGFVDYAKLKFDYKDNATLNGAFDDRVYRYPPTGALTATDIMAPGGTTYGAQSSFVHPFAVFSVHARTTNGGVYETGLRSKSGVDSPQINLHQDGRLAGKPFLFHNPSRSNFTLNLATQKPGVQPCELNFQPFLSKGDYEDYMDVDASNRAPFLSGNKSTSGIKSGSYLEIPSGPLQTIADFRRSNALTTSYLPHFVQPVSNSLLHPLMSANKVVESNPGISSSSLLDHSVLANHALYDRFYFSTFATRGATTPADVFEQFMDGREPLASQAFTPYLSAGKNTATAKSELFAGDKPKDGAYVLAAEHQLVRGPFNVNSTSVQAWKAMLASAAGGEVPVLWARNSALELEGATGTPITPMSMVNGGPVPGSSLDSAQIDNAKTNNWNGFRDLTEPELERLAEEIVEEVRERGPFLSMSEFVNRRVGPTGPLTLKGALETAIEEAEINEPQNATSANSFLNQTPIKTADITDPEMYAYKTPEASTGNPAAGAPGWVNQGDLLRILEPAATVRGDTFVIRVYGEALDPKGNVAAKAYAEAVVQRVPEYVDPASRPSTNAWDPSSGANEANRTFGRRINVTSFRWLSSNEI